MISKNKRSKRLIYFLLLFLFVSNITAFAAIDFPRPTSLKYINDYTGSISEEAKRSFISIGKELEDLTGAQAIVAVIDSTGNIPIDTYANNLFRSWGIGEKNKDNGVLILLAIKDQKWRIEVGRGLEGAITDAFSNRVMESLAKPKFAEGDYSSGLLNAYSTFCDSIATEYNVSLTRSLNIAPPPAVQYTRNNGGGIVLGVMGILFVLDMVLNRGRVSSSLINILFWSSFFRGGGGYRGGGGSSGGFGGFGGGSSNGGGSSGGW